MLKVCKEMLHKTIHKETFLRSKSASKNPCMEQFLAEQRKQKRAQKALREKSLRRILLYNIAFISIKHVACESPVNTDTRTTL